MFQSLIGILEDFNSFVAGRIVKFVRFQSLIGILEDFNCPNLKRLSYLVFKVQFRQPGVNIAFERSPCQERF